MGARQIPSAGRLAGAHPDIEQRQGRVDFQLHPDARFVRALVPREGVSEHVVRYKPFFVTYSSKLFS